MLSQQNRLKKYSAFIATYKLKNIAADNIMCIYFGKEKTSSDAAVKFAFVVSKKIHKRAVVRNRIKRLMRESIRLILKENSIQNINNYMSVICVAKPSSVNADFYQIDSSIKRLISSKVL